MKEGRVKAGRKKIWEHRKIKVGWMDDKDGEKEKEWKERRETAKGEISQQKEGRKFVVAPSFDQELIRTDGV